MKKRFIVLLASETEQQTRAFSDLFKGNFAWWHWLPNSWLIVDYSGQLTPSSLVEKVKRIYPGVNNFVTEVKEDAWVGFGPSGGDSTYFSWLKDQWKR